MLLNDRHMLKVGITGGIGSGKTIVARIFGTLGIPVFNADRAAKYLMDTDAELRSRLEAAFGTAIYDNGRVNRPLLASMVFPDPERLQLLNSIVHPRVIAWGEEWHRSQHAPYTLKEAALFFESGSYKSMDFIIGVYAPREIRIRRVMERDGVTGQEVLERMSRQMDEEEKMKLCRFVITNDDIQSLIRQVSGLHETILKM